MRLILYFLGFIELAMAVNFYHHDEITLATFSALTGVCLLFISYAIGRR